MRPGFLFCHDPLRPARPDPEFAAEVTAVRAAGSRLALIGHDALTAGDPRGAVARVPRDSGPYWYRGWMLPGAGRAGPGAWTGRTAGARTGHSA
ncbi:hypothetical protein [Streptomyces uncialis]|uniref:hypothetical protein n=1 Tax=Streptomyces uncialis TaxID=1048205 RepID=UPI003F4CC52C